MRAAFFLLFAGTRLIFSADHFLLLPNTPPAFSRFLAPEQVIYLEEGTAVIQMRSDEIEFFSDYIHRQLGGCGGFIDVTDEVEKGTAPTTIVWREIQNRQAMPSFEKPRLSFRAEVQTLVNEANIETYFSFLQELTSFPDRSATSENGAKAAKFLESRAKQVAGHLPGFQTRFVETGMGLYSGQPSVVATLTGTDSSAPHVVIGGHMDTYNSGKPGADDDGSGSAVVMEVLRSVAAHSAKFKHSIDFIWYAAEERGLVGSSYVVAEFKEKQIPVTAVIQFDMVGYNSPDDADDVYLITDNTQPQLTQTLRELLGLYTNARVSTTKCGYACSDHANWHRNGFPAAFPFEASFDNMNHRLHTPDDQISYLDWNHAHNFMKLGLAYLGHVAELASSH